MPQIDIYTKQQTDVLLGNKANTTDLPSSSELVPDTTGASQGDVLTIGADGTEWTTPSGGVGLTAHTYSTLGELYDDWIAHPDAILYSRYGVFYEYQSRSWTEAHGNNTIFMASVYVQTGISTLAIGGIKLLIGESDNRNSTSITVLLSTSIGSAYSSQTYALDRFKLYY